MGKVNGYYSAIGYICQYCYHTTNIYNTTCDYCTMSNTLMRLDRYYYQKSIGKIKKEDESEVNERLQRIERLHQSKPLDGNEYRDNQ